jgi:hypothetical protein
MARLIHTIVRVQYDVFLNALEKEYRLKEFGNNCPSDIKQRVDQVQKQMELLEKTWSVMAGRNIMADIVRELMALEPLLKPDSKAAAIGVRNNITKAMGGYSPAKARYHSVLCLGYKVPTVFAGGFQGKTDDRADMEKKAADMIKAVQAARSSVSAAHQTETTMLKVFMAPEFYFRGRNGAYDADDVNGTGKNGKGLADLLREELDKDIYKDWLFVLGTVIVASKAMKTVCTECTSPVELRPVPGSSKTIALCKANQKHVVSEEVTGAAVDNVALIVKEKLVHTVAKELVSHMDFNARAGVKDTVIMNGKEVTVNRYDQPSTYKAATDVKTTFTDERMGGCIFTLDGVTFGCEVCLDHAASTTARTAGRLDHADNIQIQLLPSGGMNVKKFRTVPNGVVFNVDGNTPHVTAIGLSSTYKGYVMKHRSDKSGESMKFTNDPTSWQDMEDDLTKSSLTAYVDNSPPPAPGPDGSVLQYGPFEIPAA